MVVDDEPFNVQAVVQVLKMLGIRDDEVQIEKCYNGQEAVDLYQEALVANNADQYQLILTDCNMPIMDGYEATKQIRQLSQSIQDEEIRDANS